MSRSLASCDVSVVIPCYNAASTIGRAIGSVMAQTLPVREVIVVDDGSQDGSAEVIAEAFPSVTLVRQENRGAAGARNTGMGRAAGRYIAFLDADDLWLPYKLELQVPVLEQNPEIGLVCGSTIWAAADGTYNPPINVDADFTTKCFPEILANHRIRTSAVIMRRTILETIGLMDERLRVAQDLDYFLRVAAAGWQIAYMSAPVTVGFNVPGSNTTRLTKLADARVEVIERWDPRRNADAPVCLRDYVRAYVCACAIGGEYAITGRDPRKARKYFGRGAATQGGPLVLRTACAVGYMAPSLMGFAMKVARKLTGRRPLQG